MMSSRATRKPGDRRQAGQAAVEAAIVLPLFVFLLLGILQLGLMHQARLVTKYAAYKAVRAGAIHNAKKDKMERAALAVLLPLVSEDRSGGEFIQSINSASDFQTKWTTAGVLANTMLDTGLKYVEVTTCGPTTAELGGSARELDFDDPQVAASDDWQRSNRTKLRIQVTFNYRMPIPFANWVIHKAAMNREIPMLMRMGKPGMRPSQIGAQYAAAADAGVFVLPIRAAYTMRMQSNLYVSQLPGSNACLTTNKF
jgi:hypothetical protein